MKNKIKVGCGFDAHRLILEEGEKNLIILGGVKVPYQFNLLAHSDGDVVLQALTDALLGTIGAGDIGVHFPPSDSQWRNADSVKFVQYAHELIIQKGGEINNVDITLICEAPKISSYREEIKLKIASILNIEIDDVNIKGTTTEKMGFTGRKEGIACQVVACVKF